ncbi:hypothetical protein [uncultured Clostridium sp.]|uniref:hypothetical protein n=1 Tax=uncultured Clostridium sp. TaxID=59620 RepID=UPI002613AC4F|nr:hypothetical protein [uncultured Clostridium sp.]
MKVIHEWKGNELIYVGFIDKDTGAKSEYTIEEYHRSIQQDGKKKTKGDKRNG